MQYRFYTADVFTHQLFGGNQLAVFPDAGDLDTALMPSIAQEFNLSETVFVFPPEHPVHTRQLRIFTPATELPFAGHPTIGTAHILASIGEISLHKESTAIMFEEGVGPATGAAATALVGDLGLREAAVSGTFRWQVEQGFEMGRPNRLEVEADKVDGRIETVRVGGRSVMVAEGRMEIPLPAGR